MLPWNLEDWLTDEGDKVVRKHSALGDAGLSDQERLLYEVWLFDSETRNGGISQYFCNHGNAQWAALCAAARSKLPSFRTFADSVDQIVAGQQDPYEAVIGSGDALDQAYAAVQARLVAELKAHAQQ
ncbi:MAG: DUF4375 domain-containing protein [Phycisphaerales bacterium]